MSRMYRLSEGLLMRQMELKGYSFNPDVIASYGAERIKALLGLCYQFNIL